MAKIILAATMSDLWLPVAQDGSQVHLFKEGEQMLEMPHEWYPWFKKLGFTFLQFDPPDHLNTNETSENCWDWTKTDNWVAKCLENGFKPQSCSARKLPLDLGEKNIFVNYLFKTGALFALMF